MWLAGVALLLAPPPAAVELRAPAGASEIVVRATARVAGAIDSIRWAGKELIDAFDHGRELQTAASFGRDGAGFWAEAYNPTEGGARADGAGPTSSSVLLRMRVTGPTLETVSRPAFWLRPGERSDGHPARNRAALSDLVIRKAVTADPRRPHALEYAVELAVPPHPDDTFAQFEAVTGYMPDEFSRFWAWDAGAGRLVPLSDGPGEQSRPVVLATPSGSHAMGVFSPDQPSPGFAAAGYGRFRFPDQHAVKWNCVFRERWPSGVPGGVRRFRAYVLVGTLDDVSATLAALTAP